MPQSFTRSAQAAQKNATLPVSVITTCFGRNRHLYNLLMSLEGSSKRPAEVIIVNDDADKTKLEQFDLNIVQIATCQIATAESDNEQTSDNLADDKQAHKNQADDKQVNKNQADDKQVNKNQADEDLANKHQIGSTPKKATRFDIGLNRNKGAKHASYDTLLFLDVDCIVSYRYIEDLTAHLNAYPNALLMGQPRYLKRPLTQQESEALKQLSTSSDWLQTLSQLNPYRHNLVTENEDEDEYETEVEGKENEATANTPHNLIEKTQDYGAFWSLCFAIKRLQFEHIGGFDTRYVGYGSEDTDFAFRARQLNIDFYLTNDVVYHQQHAVYRPPLNHLSSIVVNANLFFQKWHHWPMSGWLAEFADKGLIQWTQNQVDPIKINRLPNEVELKAAYYPDAAFV